MVILKIVLKLPVDFAAFLFLHFHVGLVLQLLQRLSLNFVVIVASVALVPKTVGPVQKSCKTYCLVI